MIDLPFLQLLRQKLSVGNRRSIHLNALPSRQLNRLDIHQLHWLNAELPTQLLQKLLTEPIFQFAIAGTPILSAEYQTLKDEARQQGLQQLTKRLDAIYYENKDIHLETGVETFALGYPILLKKDKADPTKIIKAPILIWSLSIEKSNQKAYHWTISRAEDYVCTLNPVLVSHLQNDEGIQINTLATDWLQNAEIADEKAVVGLCNHLLHLLGSDEEHQYAVVTPCPGADTIKHVEVIKPTIRWAGVFGLFKTPKEPIIQDIDQLLKNKGTLPPPSASLPYNEPNILPPQPVIFCTATPTDPSQQAIVQQLHHTKNQIVQGPPGTGKSQSLTAVLCHALANGKKTIVVCEKRTALEVLQQNLAQLGLSELSIIIEDVTKDRNRVVNAVRDRLDQTPAPLHFDLAAYTRLTKQVDNLAEILQSGHNFLARPLLAPYNWTAAIGRFLDLSQHTPPSLLTPHLNTSLFTFDNTEYEALSPSIAAAKSLYEAANTPYAVETHPLRLLHPQCFLNENPTSVLLQLQQNLPLWLPKIIAAQQQLQQTMAQYSFLLQQHYQQFISHTRKQAEQIVQQINAAFSQYGNTFDQNEGVAGGIKKVLAFMSQKHKQMLDTQQQIRKQYDDLYTYIQSYGYISLPSHPINFVDTTKQLVHFLQQLEVWETMLPARIRQEEEQVSPNQYNAATNHLTPLQIANQTYQQTIAQLASQQLLNLPIPTNTLRQQISALQQLSDTATAIQEALPYFRPYHRWQSFFMALPISAQSALSALVKANPKQWDTAFESWYLQHTIARNESKDTPTDDYEVVQFGQLRKQIQEQQPAQILQLWRHLQDLAVQRFNQSGSSTQNVKRLYNKRGSSQQQRNALRTIVQTDISLFTDFFPVLFVNPIVCSSLLPLQEGLFDFVVFDEASQLRIEDTYTAMLRGNCQIVSGDRHQMPPSQYFASSNTLLLNDGEYADDLAEQPTFADDTDLADRDSLLSYAEDLNYNRSFLDFHYRSRHPYLIDFSNAAFYGSRLVPMPAVTPYTPIQFISLNGNYAGSINSEEAEKIVSLLFDIVLPELPADSTTDIVPSVGIGTFNIYQRNFILNLLQQRRLADPIIAQKLVLLESKGLFVKNLENIQGDERDIMLLSTTFGTRPDGRFLQNFGPINQEKGYQLLNVLITRAKKQLYVVTSIPQNYYSRYAEELATTQSGRGYLYAYLAYCEAVAAQSDVRRTAVLDVLRQYCTEQSSSVSASANLPHRLFIEFVAHKLKLKLPQYRIETSYMLGGFCLDIAVFPPDSTSLPIAILCDNHYEHHLPQVFMHDVYRQEILPKLGFRVSHIYAINWYASPEAAADIWIKQHLIPSTPPTSDSPLLPSNSQ